MSTPAPADPGTEPAGRHGVIRFALFVAAVAAAVAGFHMWNSPPDAQTTERSVRATFHKPAPIKILKKKGRAKPKIPKQAPSKFTKVEKFDSTSSESVLYSWLGLAALLFLSAGFYNRALGLKGPAGLGATIGGTAAAAQLTTALAQQWKQQGVDDPAKQQASAQIAHLQLAQKLQEQEAPILVEEPPRSPTDVLRGRRRARVRIERADIPTPSDEIELIAEEAVSKVTD